MKNESGRSQRLPKVGNNIHIPEKVRNNIKKGLIYSRINGKREPFAEKLSKGDNITREDVQRIKNYFDGLRGNIRLDEQYKGEPNNDENYVLWLLNGGSVGYRWAIKLLC